MASARRQRRTERRLPPHRRPGLPVRVRTHPPVNHQVSTLPIAAARPGGASAWTNALVRCIELISCTPGLNSGPTCPMMFHYLDMPEWYAGYLPRVCDNRDDANRGTVRVTFACSRDPARGCGRGRCGPVCGTATTPTNMSPTLCIGKCPGPARRFVRTCSARMQRAVRRIPAGAASGCRSDGARRAYSDP